jgi:glycosyltransferase involved in cell wall biosynthesis/peptidoglycan/xylan/chitin deacetylase (PgdA/CDA1 family)
MIAVSEESCQMELKSAPPWQDACRRVPLRVGLLMDHPSPHMNALLEAVAARKDCSLEVLYCGRHDLDRAWGSAAGRVPHRFIDGFTGPLGIRLNPGILRIMNQTQVDIWVVNTIYGSWTTWMAAWWLRFCGKPWAFMNEPVRPRNKVNTFLKELPLRFVLSRADGIIATGKAAVDLYKRRMHRDCPYESVPYFINISDFLNLSDPVAPASGQDLQFVTSCQMIKRKGIDCLLRACEELPDVGWHLTLVGEGPLKSSLENEFRSLILRGRVSFVGAIPYLRRAMSFDNRHVFLFPSRWDGWGMVLPEALASGLPVISTDQVMSAHEFIRNGENGFIVPSENPQALADKMHWFLQNTSSYIRMSQAARKSIENYTPEVGAETLVQYLQELSARIYQQHYGQRPSLNPDQTSWRSLAAPDRPYEQVKHTLRSFGKDAIIRTSIALRRPGKAKGHLIVAYHLVLKEDRNNFEDHLKFFSDHFRISPLRDLLQASASNNQDPFRLSITFDDGFRILIQDCLELLDKYGIKASFYVPTAFTNSDRQKARSAAFSLRSFCYSYPMEPMHPGDLKKLAELGHEIGSHGIFHTSIQAMTPESAERELTVSRSMISHWTGIEPKGYAYPYGKASSSLGDPSDWLRKAGYSYGVTLTRNSVDKTTDPFVLPRHHLEGNWPVRNLRYFLLK